MKIRKIILLSEIFAMSLTGVTACNRNTSIRDIPSVEKVGTISQELLEQINNSSQGNMERIEGNNFKLTPYVDDSHFYQNTATVSWLGRGMIENTLENSFFADDPGEGGEYFVSSEYLEKAVYYMTRDGYDEKDIHYLFLDMALKNLEGEDIRYNPANFFLYARVEDDTYAEYGFADKRIDMLESVADYEGENIDYETQGFVIKSGETVKLRMVFPMKKENLDQTLCIEVDGGCYETYNEVTGRYEPPTDENVKYIYIN